MKFWYIVICEKYLNVYLVFQLIIYLLYYVIYNKLLVDLGFVEREGSKKRYGFWGYFGVFLKRKGLNLLYSFGFGLV